MLADRLSLTHPLTRIRRDGPMNTKTGNFLEEDTSERDEDTDRKRRS